MIEQGQQPGLTDEQQQALRAALDVFSDCGLDRLDAAELKTFSERLMLALLDAERFGFDKGYDAAAAVYCRDLAHAITESQELKRAH